MVKLTDREESVCKDLQGRGYDYLSESMREHYTREHEVFEELKHVDVDTLYGPKVTEVMRTTMKNAIAEGDRAVVRSLHSLCLAMDKPDEQPLTARESGSPFVASTLGFGLLAFTALVSLIPLFLGL
jgi:hypothetical protein